MIASDDLAVSAQPTAARREAPPNYLAAFGVGLLVAIMLMPIRRLLVSGTYSNGYYSDWPIIVIGLGIVIGLAVRYAAGKKHGLTLGLMAAGLTLFSFPGSEYLLMQYLFHEYGIEQGYGNLPLILPPGDMISITFEAFKNEPMDIFMGLIAVGSAFFMGFSENMGRRGWSAAASARQYGAMPSRPLPTSTAEITPAAIQPAPITLDPAAIPTEALGMGSPLRAYITSMPSLVGPVIFCVIGLGIAALVLIARDPSARLPILVVAAIPLTFGIAKLVGALMASEDKVLFFDKGLSITQKNKTATIQWNEIDRLYEHQFKQYYNGIKVQDVHNFTLHLGDGRKYVLGKRFKQIVEIGDILHVKVSELKLPAAVDAFKRGETVDFDGVKLNRNGIQVNKSVVPWSQVRDVRLSNGYVQVIEHGKSSIFGKNITVARVANVRVFIVLIQRIIANVQKQAGE